jgi:predicted RNA-binding Zn-ribbon protein involved in translation (DUF1610 family)
MTTLKELSEANFEVREVLEDLSITNTEAADGINEYCEDLQNVHKDHLNFTTTRHSVRRWREARVALDGPESKPERLPAPVRLPIWTAKPEPAEAVSARPRILLLDIEMSPNLAWTWKIHDAEIWPQYIVKPTKMLCFSANWIDEDKIIFASEYHNGRPAMMDALWQLLDEADVVIHYYGKAFDVPNINTEFLKRGDLPPSPFKQIDLCLAVKKFGFPSNKLSYVTEQLKIPSKGSVGSETWLGVMDNSPYYWDIFRDYNVNDTKILKELYYKLQPWIQQHPGMGTYTGQMFSCPNCGSKNIERRGYAYTTVSRFQRFVCRNCGKWSRSNKRDFGTGITEVAG